MRNSNRRRPQLLAVRGYMRSGTNWVGNILNQHPDITCLGEFHWHRMLKSFGGLPLVGTGGSHHHLAKIHVQEAIRRSVEDACVAASPRRRLRWVGDRTPSTIDLALYPDAHYITIVRDLRDVLVSRAYHLYSRPHIATHFFENDPSMQRRLEAFQQNAKFFTENPDELLASPAFVTQTATRWADHVISDAQVLDEHPEAKVIRLRYETLHKDTHAERERIFRFLGLDPERAEELGAKTSAGFRYEQPTAILRKGVVGDWKNYFTDTALELVRSEAGDAMAMLGYHPDSSRAENA